MKNCSTFVGLTGCITVSGMNQVGLVLTFMIRNRVHRIVRVTPFEPKEFIPQVSLVDDLVTEMDLNSEAKFWFYTKFYCWVQDIGALA